MPRIAAALAVAATLAFCIGFNTIRYPAVWEMISPLGQAPNSAAPAPVTAEPVAASLTAPMTAPTPGPITRSAARRSASPPAPAVPPSMASSWAEDNAMAPAAGPIEMAPSARFASARDSTESPESGAQQRLVPIPTAAERNDALGWAPDGAADPLLSLGTSDSVKPTRRLPPVDQTAAAELPANLPTGPLPIYPATPTP